MDSLAPLARERTGRLHVCRVLDTLARRGPGDTVVGRVLTPRPGGGCGRQENFARELATAVEARLVPDPLVGSPLDDVVVSAWLAPAVQ